MCCVVLYCYCKWNSINLYVCVCVCVCSCSNCPKRKFTRTEISYEELSALGGYPPNTVHLNRMQLVLNALSQISTKYPLILYEKIHIAHSVHCTHTKIIIAMLLVPPVGQNRTTYVWYSPAASSRTTHKAASQRLSLVRLFWTTRSSWTLKPGFEGGFQLTNIETPLFSFRWRRNVRGKGDRLGAEKLISLVKYI